MLEGEKKLWWDLDKLAVKESAIKPRTIERDAKIDAATNLMSHLEKPNHEECQQQYQLEN